MSCVIRNSPSASMMSGFCSWRQILISSATVCRICRLRPRPGPMTRTCSRSSHGSICMMALFESSSGCTISSGLYDLITCAAASGQNTCTRSAPTFSALMAAKYGAPVYSSEPPTIPIRPAWPLWRSVSR
uniref:Uncharacterized protein n=1 Tax=Anopheles atroparvus TaxID=41427 RepID=A0AAG5DHZ6_ANOAO